MTSAILALLLAGTHACPAVDLWVAHGKDLVAEVFCTPPAGTWPVHQPFRRRVSLADARTWLPGPPCVARIRNGGVTSRTEGSWRSKGALIVCVPGGGS